ncbi:MAG: acetyl-CoA carboxylase carboxyltransferase subunit beta [Planctomycetaceae bacterium]
MSTSSSETSNSTDPRQQVARTKRGVPEGLWLRCNGCQETVFRNSVEKKLGTCPECGYHFYIPTETRIKQLLDEDSFEEWFTELKSVDPLGFADRKPYPQRLEEEQKRTGLKEACTVGRGYMRGRPLVVCITDSSFIMGSMGSVVGEKLTRAIEQATALKLPLVIVSGSGGGARMHEGIFSLMQMGKVSAALARFHEAGGLYISVLTNPTMGESPPVLLLWVISPSQNPKPWSVSPDPVSCRRPAKWNFQTISRRPSFSSNMDSSTGLSPAKICKRNLPPDRLLRDVIPRATRYSFNVDIFPLKLPG